MVNNTSNVYQMNCNYRPDIDGLRAISVLFVLFFHANLFGIQAGFVGVDVFFVISGFLITTGIKNGLEKDNFSFFEFFKRRLWRLQPVFISLLIITTLVTTITYLPNDYLNFTNSAEWATQFRSNQYFGHLKTGYFGDDVSIMPLLHTWSLSIEWQWYLVLPFLMFIFYRVVRVKKLFYWVFPLTALAFVVPFCFSANNSSEHYYSFMPRIFEMLTGSCLAAIGNKGLDKIRPLVKTSIATVCLMLIISIGFSGNVSKGYPNEWTIQVCVAAALLIYLGESDHFVSKVLSWRPLVFIGVLSYSLYIWHWPVLVFMRNLAIQKTWISITIVLLLSFFLAILSYHLIENRFRKYHTISFIKSLFILVLLPYILVVSLDYYNRKNRGLSERFGNEYVKLKKIDNQYLGVSLKKRYCIWDVNETRPITDCVIGDKKSKKRALFIGDSYANHSWGFIDVLAKDSNLSVLSISNSGCLTLPDIYSEYYGKIYTQCRTVTENHFRSIKRNQYDYVILGQVWDRYINEGNISFKSEYFKPSSGEAKHVMEQALIKGLKIITDSGAIPVILNNTYDTSWLNPYYKNRTNVNKCFYRNTKLHANLKDRCDFFINEDVTRLWTESLLWKMKKEYPSLIVIDMSIVQCPNKKCNSSINNYPVFKDGEGHITDYASYRFGELYLERYGNPLK